MRSGWQGLSGRDRIRLAGAVTGSAVFRWLCFAAMVWLALHGEARPAPRVPDLLIDRIPYAPEVDRWNYVLWLVAYIPMGVFLLALAPRRFTRFMVTGGLLSLVRGVCILLTGLGPVRGEDVNAARLAEPGMLSTAFFEIIDPTGVFFRHSAHLYLTKDLFFSGHAATTFLLLLYVWPHRGARWAMLFLHVVVLASLFLAHLHYSIDIVGAYAVTFALFVLREGRPGEGLRAPFR